MARHLPHQATSGESSVRTGDAEGTKLEGLQDKVFQDRYALKNEEGTSLEEFPEQMWRRVARGIASVEPTPEKRVEWSDKFYDLLSDFKFVPGGRILSGAGTNNQVTYYNCYVVGLGEDPLNPDAPKKPMLDPEPGRIAFFDALMQMTDIMSRSGGVGINLSSLSPQGTPLAVDGRGRGGAVRPTVALSIGHPDINLFLAERDGPNLQHVDLAVVVPPDFDQALATDADWTPQWNDWRGHTVKARDLWARIHAGEARPMSILRPDTADLLVDDSRFSIVAGAAEAAMMLYRGERPVVDLSRLRPKGAYIKTVNGTSSGPVAWMYLYDAVARSDDGASPAEKGVIWYGEIASVITGKTIQQGGSRRGALMIMLDDDHPDIEEFIAAKRIDPQTNRPVMIEHANMSLCISDAFMEAVKADLPWDLKWQGKVVRTVRARDIWDKICAAAWQTAEPGVVFMQRAREQSPMWYRENIRCTNPCGEQPIPAGAVCNLGALNLARYVSDEGELLEDDLARDTAYAARFLDDVVDATPYFSDLHVKMQREGTRRVGLGTMGLADALIKMHVAYGSAESLEVIGRIYTIIRDAAYRESVALAEEKGACGFFDREQYPRGSFIQRLPQDIQQGIREHGVRNGVVLTQAPTGTTSLLAGVSSGIEPVFSFATKRVDRIGEHIMYHPLFQAWLEAHPEQQPPEYFVTAHELTPEQHVTVQARVQQYTDSSISKTSNAPHDHTVEDVKRLYTLAYELGCKGVTYYRDGSRDAVLTAVAEPSRASTNTTAGAEERGAAGVASNQPMDAEEAAMNEHSVSEESPSRERLAAAAPVPAPSGHHGVYQNGVKMRPEVVSGYTRRVRAPEGNVNVTLNSDEDGLLEVFVNIGKAGSDVAALAEALGRLISLHLRLDSPISQNERAREVARQLGAIGGSTSIGFGPNRVRSLPDAVARALEAHLNGNAPATAPAPGLTADSGDAPQSAEAGGHAPSASGGAPANGSAGGGGQPNGHGPNPGTLALYTVTGNLCPQCGNNTLYMEEGCKKCVSCGHSEC
ncbi:MAG TPA: adenosylcobalamin-dependent ribonucleoside-diphosphate reductase [Ktedonobacterales bacterium]